MISMRFSASRNVGAALRAALLYLLFALLAIAAAPRPGLAGEPPQALVVRLARNDDPKIEIWRSPTDLEAPVGSETGPTTSPNCAVEAMVRIPIWLRDHLPGWEVREWRCIPAADVDRFLKSHRAADI